MSLRDALRLPALVRWLGHGSVATALGLAVYACDAGLGLPADADISCRHDDECPTTMECNIELGRCFEPAANLAPSLVLEPIARAVRTLPVTVRVIDPNAAPHGDDVVAVEFEYLNGDVWVPAIDAAGSSRLEGLSQLGTEAPYVFTWSLAAETQRDDGEPLLDAAESTAVYDSGGLVTGTELAGYTDGVQIRARAIDREGAASTWATSNAVSVGNDAPAVLQLEAPKGRLRGLIPLELVLADSASDIASLSVEFRTSSDPAEPWRSAAIVMGELFALPTSPTGVVHVLVWDSREAKRALVADALEFEQGIGVSYADAVRVRARACDNPQDIGDSLLAAENVDALTPTITRGGYWGYCGAWVELAAPLEVDNLDSD